MKISKFNEAVGSINHWAGSHTEYKNMTVFLTEQLEVLRFDHQTCDWSLINISTMQWVSEPEQAFIAANSALDTQAEVKEDGSHLVPVGGPII